MEKPQTPQLTSLTNGGRTGDGLLIGDGFHDSLGCQHSALHGVVGALDLRYVHEAWTAANQTASRECQFGNALEENGHRFKITDLT